MLALLKKDLLVNIIPLLLFSLMIIIATPVYPMALFYIFIVYGSFVGTFYFEHKANVNIFMIGLPVKKVTIVRSRYVFIFIEAIVLLSVMWLANLMTYYSQDTDTFFFNKIYLYNFQDIALVFSIAILLFAFCMPIQYVFQAKFQYMG